MADENFQRCMDMLDKINADLAGCSLSFERINLSLDSISASLDRMKLSAMFFAMLTIAIVPVAAIIIARAILL